MPGRTRMPRSVDPEKNGQSQIPLLRLGDPEPETEPSLLGNQELLERSLGRGTGPVRRPGLLDFDHPSPTLDPRLRLPILDGVPFGGKIRDTVDDWLVDPYGKDGPDPKPTAPETRPDAEPNGPTMIRSPKIPF